MKAFEDKSLLLEDVRRYIDTHLMEEIEIKALAKLYGYSYERFRKFFQAVTGTTFHQYIRLRRLQFAAKRMRLGDNVNEAYRQSCFQTLSGFIRAFREVFGVSPYEYAATRGRVLMTEPELRSHPDFYVVGYVFKALPDLNWMESGAYWQGQSFPDVLPEEYARIGGGEASVGVWVRRDRVPYHVFGPLVHELGFVPFEMHPVWVPSGDFLVFRAPPHSHNVELGENMRMTWYYAYEQWFPESEDYAVDWDRLPFEYYLNDDNLIYIPVLPKSSADETRRDGSEHPPVLLQGKRDRWDRWDEEHNA